MRIWVGGVLMAGLLLQAAPPPLEAAEDSPAPTRKTELRADFVGAWRASGDARFLAARSAEGDVETWEAGSPKPLAKFEGAAPEGARPGDVRILFARDGERFAVLHDPPAGKTTTIAVFPATGGAAEVRRTSSAAHPAGSGRFLGRYPVGDCLVYLAGDGKAEALSLETLAPPSPAPASLPATTFHASAEHGVLVRQAGRGLAAHDLESGEELWSVDDATGLAGRAASRIGPDRCSIRLRGIVGDAGVVIGEVWKDPASRDDVATCDVVAFDLEDGAPAWVLARSRAHGLPASGSVGAVLVEAAGAHLVDARTGRIVAAVDPADPDCDAVVPARSDWAFLNRLDGTLDAVRLPRIPKDELPPRRSVNPAHGLAVSPDGRFVATFRRGYGRPGDPASTASAIRLYRTHDPEMHHEVELEPGWDIERLEFSADGRFVVTEQHEGEKRRSRVTVHAVDGLRPVQEYTGDEAELPDTDRAFLYEDWGRVRLTGVAPALGAVVLNWKEQYGVVLDPVTRAPLAPDGLRPSTSRLPMDGQPEKRHQGHFDGKQVGIDFDHTGRRFAAIELGRLEVGSWPRGEVELALSEDELGKIIRGFGSVHHVRFGPDGTTLLLGCLTRKSPKKDGKTTLVCLRIAGKSIAWKKDGASVEDVSGPDRGQLVIGTVKGSELLDATGGRRVKGFPRCSSGRFDASDAFLWQLIAGELRPTKLPPARRRRK